MRRVQAVPPVRPPLWRRPWPQERVIGVDLGGTKILAGVVGRDGEVVRRRERPTPVESQEAAGRAGRVRRGADGAGVVALGFSIPSRIDQRAGRALSSVNIPLHDVDFRERMEERFGLPVGIENDAERGGVRRVAPRRRARTRPHGHAHARDRRRRRAHARRPALPRLGRSSGTWSSSTTASRAGLRRPRPLESYCTGRRGRGASRARCSGRPPTRTGSSARERGRRAGDRGADGDRPRARLGIGSLVNIFDAERVVIGGGFGVAAFEHLLGPALEVVRREALPPADESLSIAPAELGTAAGRHRGGPDRVRGARVRSCARVCATPIGNLEDVTLRVLRELRRGGRRALRGHAANADPARPPRDLGAAALVPRAQRGGAHGGAAAAAARRASASRSCRDAGLPAISDPGARLVAAALEAGVPVTVLPGPVGGRDRARRERPRGRAVPVRRLPAARRAGARGALGGARRVVATPSVAFESPQRLPATLRSLAAALPERPVAVCRELTKQFEEVVRGTGRRGRGALRRAAEGRDHARDRRRAGSRGPDEARRSRRWRSSSSARGAGGAQRPSSSPG